MIRHLFAACVLTSTLLLGTAGSANAADRPLGVEAFHVAEFRPPIERFQVRGRVTYFHGFALTLRSGGRPVAVALHQGTVILPTGLTLQPGMFVRVDGHWDRQGSFHANRIVLAR